jgi:hypothetical protein
LGRSTFFVVFFLFVKIGAKTILSSSISNHSDHEVPMRCMF